MYKHHITTKDSITVITDRGVFPIHRNSKNYEQVKGAIQERRWEAISDLVDHKGKIFKNTEGLRKGVGCFKMIGDRIVLKGTEESLSEALATKVLQFVQNGVDTAPLEKFWKNLMRNPNKSSRQDLYNFISANKIAITEDGCFIAYKYVTKDFMDCNSGKFDNHPGKIVRMPREDCDSNNQNTCSRGLHICAYSYLSQASTDRNIIECKVNPRHVVAVPPDYSQQKMRCCEYEVLHSHDSDDGEIQDLVYTSRTYYYKRIRSKAFDVRAVTSHKPSRFYMTCRANNTDEAQKKFKKMLTK